MGTIWPTSYYAISSHVAPLEIYADGLPEGEIAWEEDPE